MFQFINRLRRRWLEPKIYSIFLTSQPCGCWRMHLGVDHTLEDAMANARKVVGAMCPHNVPYATGGWTIMTLEMLERAMTVSDLKPSEQNSISMDAQSEKNELMQTIIKTKDVGKFEEARPRLTPAEISFIEDELNRK